MTVVVLGSAPFKKEAGLLTSEGPDGDAKVGLRVLAELAVPTVGLVTGDDVVTYIMETQAAGLVGELAVRTARQRRQTIHMFTVVLTRSDKA